jgi:hypothetical protein
VQIVRTGLAALTCLLGFSSIGAKADIVFCNKSNFKLIYVAIAYPQSDGTFLSRGWMSVSEGECDSFDTALQVKSLWFRGESQWVRQGRRRSREIWGKGRAFAIWENDNFQYYNAQERVLKSTLENFSLAGEVADGALDVTVTFTDTGSFVNSKSAGQNSQNNAPADNSGQNNPAQNDPPQNNPTPAPPQNSPAPSPPQQAPQQQPGPPGQPPDGGPHQAGPQGAPPPDPDRMK